MCSRRHSTAVPPTNVAQSAGFHYQFDSLMITACFSFYTNAYQPWALVTSSVTGPSPFSHTSVSSSRPPVQLPALPCPAEAWWTEDHKCPPDFRPRPGLLPLVVYPIPSHPVPPFSPSPPGAAFFSLTFIPTVISGSRSSGSVVWCNVQCESKKLGNFRNIEQIFTKFGRNHALFLLNILP